VKKLMFALSGSMLLIALAGCGQDNLMDPQRNDPQVGNGIGTNVEPGEIQDLGGHGRVTPPETPGPTFPSIRVVVPTRPLQHLVQQS
jgi:hypothetical protein